MKVPRQETLELPELAASLDPESGPTLCIDFWETSESDRRTPSPQSTPTRTFLSIFYAFLPISNLPEANLLHILET